MLKQLSYICKQQLGVRILILVLFKTKTCNSYWVPLLNFSRALRYKYAYRKCVKQDGRPRVRLCGEKNIQIISSICLIANWMEAKTDYIQVILSEIQVFPSQNWSKSTSSPSKFTSRFLLWWRKTPCQY